MTDRLRTLCGCEREVKALVGREYIVPIMREGRIQQRRFRRDRAIDGDGWVWLEQPVEIGESERRAESATELERERRLGLERRVEELLEAVAEQAEELSRLRRGKAPT